MVEKRRPERHTTPSLAYFFTQKETRLKRSVQKKNTDRSVLSVHIRHGGWGGVFFKPKDVLQWMFAE